MAEDRSSQDDILQVIVQRLREKIGSLNQANCFLCDTPLPGFRLQGDHVVTVACGDGQYDDRLYTGAGAATLAERANMLVTILIRSHLDEPGQVTAALLDPKIGIMGRWKRTLLRTILVEEISDGTFIEWRPTKNGKQLLRQGILPRTASAPAVVEKTDEADQTWIAMTLTFEIMWDWKL